ncbi:aminotransferase class V-fold PLP-dependent enzyme [Bernardetia sp.]|uniref:aminotransferase class V-fold PLP-dependent enzyme n=1 Tax=Bernardetia sp. TaxID=1937974 RepID=UPI0025BB21B5|nr:aminotransferase class V-fold PLP-dependent enzyme [Bernardetia sp.]
MKIYLTPGPSENYFIVEEAIKEALKNKVTAISHRSKEFKAIFEHTVSELRELLQLPANFSMAFTGSANEIWERILQNCVEKESFHLVNGSFSKKFYQFAEQLHLSPSKYEVKFGEGFEVENINVPSSAELIAVIQNETSSGVQFPVENIAKIREKNHDKLIVVDAVSSLPYANLDYSVIDSVYFSVQKGFGVPAGLGVWVYNDKMIEKAKNLEAKGKSIGTYHSLLELDKYAKQNQTPETPNVLAIYVLGKVAEAMNKKGMAMIRRETDYKAELLYHTLEKTEFLSPVINDKVKRSKTVVVANVEKGTSSDVVAFLEKKKILIGKGYGSYKDSQIRIANFPTHSKELIEQVADFLMEYGK